jgi:hypothetical protein
MQQAAMPHITESAQQWPCLNIYNVAHGHSSCRLLLPALLPETLCWAGAGTLAAGAAGGMAAGSAAAAGPATF